MKEKLLKEFNYLYREEEIKKVMYIESKQYIIIECMSGYAYKVEYNNGNITTSCLN